MKNAEWHTEPDLLVVKFTVLDIGLRETERRLKIIQSMTQGHHCQRVLFIVRSKNDYDFSIMEIMDYTRSFAENLVDLRTAIVDNTPSASPARQTMGNAIFKVLLPDDTFTARVFRHERAARHWLNALPPR